MTKAEARRQAAKRISEIGAAERFIQDESIFCRLMGMRELIEAKTVFCYVSTGEEIDTRRLIEFLLGRGKSVCVPRCGDAGHMDACRIQSLDELSPKGKFMLDEPEDSCDMVEPENIDLVILPGVAFGENLSSLGRGGGYYDRFLANCKAFCVGLCREALIFDSLPERPHDVRVDAVVTECRTLRQQERN